MDEARDLLAHFWIKGTEWCHGLRRTSPFAPGSGDAQVYQNVILGGTAPDGGVENEVSRLVLEVVEELHISDFPIAVRLHAGTPDDFLRQVARVQLRGGGIVSVYGEETVLAGLRRFGWPEEEARNFTNDGCWEVIIPGRTAFGYRPIDTLEIFQRLLAEREDWTDFEELFAAWSARLAAEIDRRAEAVRDFCRGDEPAATLSLLMPSCRQSGRSYLDRGAAYTVSAVHAGGLPDVANSLLALKRLVFDESVFSGTELAAMLRNDWAGCEAERRTAAAVAAYGSDDDAADAMMRRVFDDYAATAARFHERYGVLMPAGVSTFGREIEWAAHRGATPFGRFAHEYLAPNLSPTPGTERGGATAVLNSYCKMDFTGTPNGCPLDLRLEAGLGRLPGGAEIVAALLKGFRLGGGWYLQLDVVDPAMLEAAKREPDRFPNLVVRISGWSARFATLAPEWQEMVIRRTALER